LAAGASAGVAVAFGAPIGGALFAYEMSTPNTFWTFNLLWRNFFCSAVSTFVLGILTSLWNNKPVTLSDAAILKFGIMPEEHPIPLYELSGAVIIGFVCGIMGAIFVRVNICLLKLRKKTIKRNW
jgi:chloride channel 3/4/5